MSTPDPVKLTPTTTETKPMPKPNEPTYDYQLEG